MINPLENDNVREVFELAIIWLATSDPMIKVIASMAINDETFMTPVARFVAKKAEKEVKQAAQQLLLVAQPSPSPSTGDLVSWEKQLDPLQHRKLPQHKRIWLPWSQIAKEAGPGGAPTTWGRTSSSANKLKKISSLVTQPVSKALGDVFAYRIYQPHSSSLSYYGKRRRA